MTEEHVLVHRFVHSIGWTARSGSPRLPHWRGPSTGETRTMATQRFLTLDDVAEILNVSWSQAYALVRRKELIAIQIGGRGQWRVEKDELERFIQQKYAEARGSAGEPEPEPADADADADADTDAADADATR
jgi:excisionase family DNA binding protein